MHPELAQRLAEQQVAARLETAAGQPAGRRPSLVRRALARLLKHGDAAASPPAGRP